MGAGRETSSPLSHPPAPHIPARPRPAPPIATPRPPRGRGCRDSEPREGGPPPPGAGGSWAQGRGDPAALGLDRVMRAALVNVPPVWPGASSSAFLPPTRPLNPVRCGRRVLPLPLPCRLPVLLLLLLLCLVRWLRAWALPSRASAFFSQASGGKWGEAELKQLGWKARD